MAYARTHRQAWIQGTIATIVAVLATACESPRASAPLARDPSRLSVLQGEVSQLSARVRALETQLLQEHRNSARARQETLEQRERIAALEGQVQSPAAQNSAAPAPTNDAVTMQAEAELRVAYRALMRAIERMDISAEEKAALKTSLRPTRTLDRTNPWSVAKQ